MNRTISLAAAKREARQLFSTAQVSPLRMTLLLLAITFPLTVLSQFADSLGLFSLLSVPQLGISFFSVLVRLMGMVLTAGYILYALRISAGECVPYASLFDGFTFVGRILLANILVFLCVALWSTFLLIPGLIACYRYCFTIHNLCLDPDCSPLEAMRRSRRQTRGHLWALFCKDCGFAGWYLLVILPVIAYTSLLFADIVDFPGDSLTGMLCFLACLLLSELPLLWVRPYWTLTTVQYYRRFSAPPSDDTFRPDERFL